MVIKMLRLEESETYKMLLQKGKEEGIKEGEREGEKKAKITIAKELLKKGMGIDEIAEITKLPKEDIKKLLK